MPMLASTHAAHTAGRANGSSSSSNKAATNRSNASLPATSCATNAHIKAEIEDAQERLEHVAQVRTLYKLTARPCSWLI